MQWRERGQLIGGRVQLILARRADTPSSEITRLVSVSMRGSRVVLTTASA